jgi:aspartyl-tRNA(Asn)/glutamyl-tRNA(Gln) amidotransferase subunit C
VKPTTDFGLAAGIRLSNLWRMSDQGMDVHYVAQLARLELTPEEERHLGEQLGQVLQYVEKLKALDVDEVEPTAHAAPRVNVMRPDELGVCLDAEEALRNAPAQNNSLFKVPKIVE